MKKALLLLLTGFFLMQMSTTTTFATTFVTTGQTVTTTTTTTTVTTKKVKKASKFKLWIAKMAAKASSKDPIIAAVIAFFLGGLGIHRVYMGSKPIMILWYILTLGGIFGLLPLIDFIRLLIGHGDHYEGNEKLFAAFGSK